MNLKLSHNGRYLAVGDTLHDLSIMESYNVSDLSFGFWIQFLKENTIGTFKNKVKDNNELNNFLREFVYNISELFEGKNKDSFIFEYELKYSNTLIKEGVENQLETIENLWLFIENKLITNNILEQEDSWLDKAKKSVSGAFDWVKEKGVAWVMENLRSALYSWGGAAVQTFLGTVGAPYGGNVVLWVVWGAMLAYDIYEAISGRPNYANILIDIISIATFGIGGKILVQAFKKLGIMSGPVTRNLPQMLQKISTSSIGKWFAGTIQTVGNSMSSILSYLGKGVTYAGDKLGLSAVKSSGSRITSWARDFISKLTINPTIKKLAPTAASAGVVAGINKATGQDNSAFAGSFGKRGDEIYATSKGVPSQKEVDDMMAAISGVEADYEGLLP
jgi:hypothetical protein